jgi:shikimate kinase
LSRSLYQRILLVGFMGSGKTTVGRAVAEALHWRFADVDAEVERRADAPIHRIFEQEGETVFRAMEARAAEDLLGEERVVIATGGGWAAVPGRMESLPADTAVVWLQVSAAEAVRRTEGDPVRRPLLESDDPIGRARALLAERDPYYAKARWAIDTDPSSVDDVTARILEMLRVTGIEERTS